MYKAIVRRIVRAGFRALSAGEYEHGVRQFHPQVLFSFAGPAPLGGERRGVAESAEKIKIDRETQRLFLVPVAFCLAGCDWLAFQRTTVYHGTR